MIKKICQTFCENIVDDFLNFPFIFQAYIKIANMSTSTTVDYRFGDDNIGSFHFPKITMCPDKVEKI